MTRLRRYLQRILLNLELLEKRELLAAPFLSVGTMTFQEGSLTSWGVYAYDPDNDPLSFWAGNLPSWATLNTGTG